MSLPRTLRSQFISAVRESFIMKYDRTQLEDLAFEGTIDNDVLGVHQSPRRDNVELFTKQQGGHTLTHKYDHKKLLDLYLDEQLEYDYITEYRVMVNEIYNEAAVEVGLAVSEYIPLLDAVQEIMYKLQPNVRSSMNLMRNRPKIEFTKPILTPIIDNLLNHDLNTLRNLVTNNDGELTLHANDGDIKVCNSGKNGSLVFDNGEVSCHVIQSSDGTLTVLHDFTLDREPDTWIPVESVHYLKLLIDLSNNLGKYIRQYI